MRSLYEVIRRPLITEKAVTAKEALNRYHFEVARDATKPAIRKAVESYFKVKVKEVRTLVIPGKTRRFGRYNGLRPSAKKAIVTVLPGQKIEIFEMK